MMKYKLLIIGLIAPFLIFSQTDETSETIQKNEWEFNVTPYIWFSGLSADISFLNQNIPVEASFSDVVKNLKMAGLLHAEAKNGRWIIITDLVYMKLDKGGRIDLLNLDTSLKLKQFIADLDVGYNLLNVDDWLFLDVYGGLRYFETTSQLNVGAQTLLDRTINVNDPVLGVRFKTITEKWINGAQIDAGGFGIGSEISWKGNIYAGYRFSKTFSMLVGFQGYGIDYEKDSFGLDLVVAGFATGFNFNF
jgi:hypothetical protein